eukprot:comp12977_c0_seq1/m.8210 comp12977_c0_seq1/g.8210  ORF comp12977_c0_seq1/g.8210 comp12977_c0_seq1/m.8210 type:complete len:211 (-) comp12977_c0_seq1:37-669(-)
MQTPARHAVAYKQKSPYWKEEFRQKCFDRLRKSRDAVLMQKRTQADGGSHSIADEVVMAEWSDFSQRMGIAQSQDSQGIVDETDYLIRLMEDISEELRREEQQMLAEYHLHQEDAELAAALESRDAVCCPVCKQNRLHQNLQIIFCACGFRLDTQQDNITLEYLQTALQRGIDAHSEVCDGIPDFTLSREMGPATLLMTCSRCDCFHVVI